MNNESFKANISRNNTELLRFLFKIIEENSRDPKKGD